MTQPPLSYCDTHKQPFILCAAQGASQCSIAAEWPLETCSVCAQTYRQEHYCFQALGHAEVALEVQEALTLRYTDTDEKAFEALDALVRKYLKL